MKPELVLSLRPGENPREKMNEWLKAYQKYEQDVFYGEIVSRLAERVQLACRLMEEGRWEDNPELDGDFPMGNARDAAFLNQFFTIRELVEIQIGKGHQILAHSYGKTAPCSSKINSGEELLEKAKQEVLPDEPCFYIMAHRHDLSSIAQSQRERHSRQMDWYLKAAELGNCSAMCAVATAYHFGYPCQKDNQKAFYWAEKGAELGAAECCYQMGIFHENGLGCSKSMQDALPYYIRSAEGGILPAMLRLNAIYRDGVGGVMPDMEKAGYYLSLADTL